MTPESDRVGVVPGSSMNDHGVWMRGYTLFAMTHDEERLRRVMTP